MKKKKNKFWFWEGNGLRGMDFTWETNLEGELILREFWKRNELNLCIKKSGLINKLSFLFQISRQSIDACKDYFRDDLIKADWALMVELKKMFEIL